MNTVKETIEQLEKLKEARDNTEDWNEALAIQKEITYLENRGLK